MCIGEKWILIIGLSYGYGDCNVGFIFVGFIFGVLLVYLGCFLWFFLL